MKLLIKSIFCGALFLGLAACDNYITPEMEEATKGREANLGFHLVHSGSDNAQTLRIAIERNAVPAGTILRPFPKFKTHLLIVERTRIDQDCIGSAKEGLQPETNKPILNFRFNDYCAELFGKLTTENIGKRFAVVVDDIIVTAPFIRAAITDGAGFIEGGFDDIAEAKELADIINKHARALREKGKE